MNMSLTDFFERNKEYGTVILRIGLAVVFLWFGIDKFIHVQNWIGWIPDWMVSIIPLSLATFMYFQGFIETLVGLALLIGFRVRTASFFAALAILGVLASLIGTGQTEILLRDLGLLAASISLVFTGARKLAISR